MKKEGSEFVVRLTLPPGVTAPQMRDYIRDAVCGWKGQYDIGHPIFVLDRSSVQVNTVKPLYKTKGTEDGSAA